MQKPGLSGAIWFVLSVGSACGLVVSIPGQTAERPSGQLQIESNLVEVRVVVRDGQGRPIEGLTREDFKILDQGKRQEIAHFEAERASGKAATSAAQAEHGTATETAATANQNRFIAFYFDDVDASDADLIMAREAADHYLASSLRATDRVAIFTSKKVLTDFTSDAKQIHEALMHLHSSASSMSRVQECPALSEYEALEILQTNDTDSNAWRAAWADAKACPAQAFVNAENANAAKPDGQAMNSIRMLAQRVADQADGLARTNIDQVKQVVDLTARMPGQRTAILVSPGFMSQGVQAELDGIVERALRAQVVVNALNPRGLAMLMREADATQENAGTRDPVAGQARNTVDREREFRNSDVLSQLARSTGGEFFHDDNDLKAGFDAVAGRPATYVLAFAPKDIKLDGKFHMIKVELAQKQKGYSVSARRGYFAIAGRGEGAAAAKPQAPATNATGTAGGSAAPAQQSAVSSDLQEQREIQQALQSTAEVSELTVKIDANPSQGLGETRMLALTIHAEAQGLSLRKDAGHNTNGITFAVAVFDGDGKVVQVKKRRVNVNLTDSEVEEFAGRGVDVNMMFEVKPGSYRVRGAVVELNEHKVGTASRTVVVP